jgi:hypothetical protein
VNFEELNIRVKNMGDVYIFGDFNARRAEYNDFIRFDTRRLTDNLILRIAFQNSVKM